MPLTQVSSRAIEDTLRYVLGASGTNHYTFTGKGLNGAVNAPTLTLSRGHTYIFENRNSNGAHPFYIKTSIANGGTNDAYNTGVTNNGGAGGTEIVFTVPHDAPDTLYYQCSSHINMAGQLNIAGSVADGSITESKLADDAVTADKLANSINSAIAANTAKDLTALSASNLTSGTVPDARFPATLPAASAANLTSIPAANLTGTLPALSATNLTNVPAANITGNLPAIDGSSLTGISTGANPNLIINGAMEIHQRPDGTYSSTLNGYAEIDRFHIWASNAGKLNYERVTEAPPQFEHSFKITSNSAYTPTSGNYFYVGQKIEGHNWKHLQFGSSNAKTITISFWVRSSITGTWSGIVKNNEQNRTYPWEYTISSANTWEKKTITVAGDTGGNWRTDNGAGAWIYFCIGNHSSSYLGSANSWQASNLIGTTGSNSLVNTNGATWYMTGLKVEEGSSATDFQLKLYDEELRRCQRYFYMHAFGAYVYQPNTPDSTPMGNSARWTNVSHYGMIYFPVQMRAHPSLYKSLGTDRLLHYAGGNSQGFNDVSTQDFGINGSIINYVNSLDSSEQAGWVQLNNNNAYVGFDAEL